MPKSKAADVEDDDLDVDEILGDLDEDDEVTDDEDEDVEEDDDEDVEDDEEEDEDEEDEDPDEAPKARKRKSSSKKSAAKKVKSGVGTAELAEAAGITPRVLRGYLRNKKVQPQLDEEGVRRYHWKSLNDPEAKKILRGITEGAEKRAQKAETKEVKARKPKPKKSTSKKSTGRKRRARAKA